MKERKKDMPRPGFEPGLLRPQRSVLTTRRSRLSYAGSDTYSSQNLIILTPDNTSFSFPRHPASRRFLSGMAFSIYVVARAACQSRSWFVFVSRGVNKQTTRLTSDAKPCLQGKHCAGTGEEGAPFSKILVLTGSDLKIG